jgi:hypothetical protein
MDHKPSGNIFIAVHRIVAEKKVKMRKAQQYTAGVLHQQANDEAKLEGFDCSSTSPLVPDEEITQ